MTHSFSGNARELADAIESHVRLLASTSMTLSLITWQKISSDLLEAAKALRFAPQPVATVKPAAWGRMIDGEAVTVSRIKNGANDEPLYAMPVATERELLKKIDYALRKDSFCDAELIRLTHR